MNDEESVFEKTYRYYLEQIGDVDMNAVAWNLDATVEKDGLIIPLFGEELFASANGIQDAGGNRPSIDICVILSKYILICPKELPVDKEWVSYRDFRDAGPLINYFSNDVEQAIGKRFAGKLDALQKAGEAIGGYTPELDVSNDVGMQFDALPRIPMTLLFNDADDEFEATCSVLFQRRTEQHLDAECIAMLGWQLAYRLKKVAG